MAGIAIAAIVAVLVVLGSDDSASSPDRYTIGANRLCRTARDEVASATQRHHDALQRGDPNPLARAFFTAVGELQSRLGELDPPDDKVVEAAELHEAVFEWEQPILDLIRISTQEGQRVRADTEQLESVNSTVRGRAAALHLVECARLSLRIPGFSR